jgi:hypothetical protein
MICRHFAFEKKVKLFWGPGKKSPFLGPWKGMGDPFLLPFFIENTKALALATKAFSYKFFLEEKKLKKTGLVFNKIAD